jgi:hypothetical protein
MTHSTLHKLYRPDETAEGIAQRVARQSNPAANLNANSVVIHDLHRPGAPGLDQTPTATAEAAPKSSVKTSFRAEQELSR